MKNPFSGLFRARDKPRDAVSSAPSFYFGSSASGTPAAARLPSIRCTGCCMMSPMLK